MRALPPTLAARGALVLACAALAACSGGERPTSVLLVTLDTTRADALTPYGAPAAVTPTMDLLARQGVLYERASTVAPLTLPAHASMLTGLYPPRHGVRDNGVAALSPSAWTVAEAARAAGWQTAAFVGSVVLDDGFGLDQGFELYDVPPRPVRQERTLYAARPARVVAQRAVDWLARRDRERPFFAWVHFWDPHDPYEPAPELARRAGGSPYLGEVLAADLALGDVLAALQDEGALASTVVLVVGDHGEAFGEHGEVSHASYCYQSTLRVPLLVRHPDGWGAGERVRELVTVVDVAPTLLEAMGLAVPEGVDGVSLHRRAPPGDRGVYFESYYGYLNYGWSPLVGWRDARGKYLHSSQPQLFEPTTDPGEERDLAVARAGELERYRAELERVHRAPALSRSADGVDAELREQVRRLGYVAGSADDGPLPLDAPGRPSPASRADEQRRLQLAEARVEQGRLAEAEELLERIVADNPRNLPALEWLARARLRQERFAEAREPLEQALELSPARPDSWTQLGACHLALGEPGPAAEAFRRALAIDPGHPQALAALILVLEGQGRPDEAAPLRERLAAIESRR